MQQPDSIEKEYPPPCPYLPGARPAMSYRDLRLARSEGPPYLFRTSLEYAQFLWGQSQPARAILALCRAVYLDPAQLAADTVPPYRAYSWMLRKYRGAGFLGNPRISFFHQATRMDIRKSLFRQRAWALWYLTTRALPELPPDPQEVEEAPPGMDELACFLNSNGLPGEGDYFIRSLRGE